MLLDDFEPGMKTAEVRAVFDELKEGLVPLVAEIAERADAVDDSLLRRRLPDRRQQAESADPRRLRLRPRDSWRLDETLHPFAVSDRADDVRLTTQHDARQPRLDLLGRMHEFGHGLYEAGVDPALYADAARRAARRSASTSRRAACGRTSSAAAGRSGSTTSRCSQEAFPGELAGARRGGVLPRGQPVQPSLIRIEADEATYNLHIILRFELEQEMVTGRLAAADAARSVEREDAASTSGSRCPTSPTACSRTCTGRAARSATSRPTRSAT